RGRAGASLLREVQPHLAIALRIVGPILANFHIKEQVNLVAEELGQLLSSLHRDLLDGSAILAEDDLTLAFPLHEDDLLDPHRTIASVLPTRRLDGDRVR